MKRLVLILPLLVFSLAKFCFAVEVSGRVKYVSSSNIYLDIGSSDGLQPGDVGVIYRGENKQGAVEIVFVAEHSASCKWLEGTSPPRRVRVGDRVMIEIGKLIEPADSLTLRMEESLAEITARRKIATKKVKRDRLSGSVGLRYFMQDDRGEDGYDYRQPSLRLRATLTNLLRSHYNLNVRMRSRRIDRASEIRVRSRSEWDNRVYELSLYYDNPTTNHNYSLGRLAFNRVSGIGVIDGIMYDYRSSPELILGGFAGTEPDYETSSINSEEIKAGFYAHYSKGSYRTLRVSSTAALAGIYSRGEIDREFIYIRNSLSQGRKYSIHQNAEINLNRGWQGETGGGAVQLSYISINFRYSPIEILSTHIGYNRRRTMRTLDSRDVPDSLFDNALRQGVRIGSSIKLPADFRLSMDAGIRTNAGDESRSSTFSVNLRSHNLFHTGLKSGIRFNTYTNRFNQGRQSVIDISRSIFKRALSLGCQVGVRNSELKGTDIAVKDEWIELRRDYWLSRRYYGSVAYEIGRGDDSHVNRLSLDLGIRL